MMRDDRSSNHQRLTCPAHSILLFAFFLTFLTTVAAEDDNPKSRFIFPDRGFLPIHLHDTLLVSYISSFPTPSLYLWCDSDDGPKNIFAQEPSAPFNGTQPVYFNFTSNTPCWWNLRREFNTPDGANGPDFEILSTERPGGPTTISAPPPSSTATSSSTASTTPNVNSPSTTGTASDENHGLSSTAAIGIGVGVGVVVAVLFCAAVILFRSWKRKVIAKAVKMNGEHLESSGTSTTAASRAGTSRYPLYPDPESRLTGTPKSWATPEEMPASREVAEMAAESQMIEMPAEIVTTDHQEMHVRQDRYV